MSVEALQGAANNQGAGEITVGPLLARAKLLRQRGQWEESIAICTDALRHAPESVTAYSLLGEIYESMGKLDDATQWYAMAVERAPGDPQEKAKLERTLMAQQAQRPVVLKAQTAPPVRERTLNRTLQWFDRVFPPGKADSIARLIFAVSGILAAFLLVSAAVVFFFFRQGGNQVSQLGGSELLPTVVEPMEPVIVMPRAANTEAPIKSGAFLTSAPAAEKTPVSPSAPSAVKHAPAPVRNAPALASRSNPPSAPDGKASATSDPDAELRLEIARAAGVTLASVQPIRRDSRGQAVGVEVTLPGEQGEPDSRTRRRVLLAAAQAAQTVTRFDPATQYAAVRVNLYAPPRFAGDIAHPERAFTGECELTYLRNADPGIMTADELLNKFQSPAWGEVFGGPPTAY